MSALRSRFARLNLTGGASGPYHKNSLTAHRRVGGIRALLPAAPRPRPVDDVSTCGALSFPTGPRDAFARSRARGQAVQFYSLDHIPACSSVPCERRRAGRRARQRGKGGALPRAARRNARGLGTTLSAKTGKGAQHSHWCNFDTPYLGRLLCPSPTAGGENSSPPGGAWR